MNNKIHIFIGANRDFEAFLNETIPKGEERFYFLELIKDYNANLRVQHAYNHGVIEVENLIVHGDDYASVYEHVIQNFVFTVTTNHNVENTFLHNPPQRVIDSLKISYSDVMEYHHTEYKDIDKDVLKEVWRDVTEKIVGQEKAKKDILSNLYRLCDKENQKPVVLLFLGDSGIGKTETAKAISATLGGNLLRVQFSMVQTAEGYNYVFGAEHSKSSLAKDLMRRETNIVLIDEFDKVHPNFYNAFYQMFDEGLFVDTNYRVDVSKCIIICTSNFRSDKEVINKMGMPIFSRFNDSITFQDLSTSEKEILLDQIYQKCLLLLSDDEKKKVEDSDIYAWHKQNLSHFNNVRIIRNRVEKAINDRLIDDIINGKEPVLL